MTPYFREDSCASKSGSETDSESAAAAPASSKPTSERCRPDSDQWDGGRGEPRQFLVPHSILLSFSSSKHHHQPQPQGPAFRTPQPAAQPNRQALGAAQNPSHFLCHCCSHSNNRSPRSNRRIPTWAWAAAFRRRSRFKELRLASRIFHFRTGVTYACLYLAHSSAGRLLWIMPTGDTML